MTQPPEHLLDEIRRTLTAWHATHPEATFAEMEEAVEGQLHRMRASLLAEQVEQTGPREYPTCQHCGSTMEPRARTGRRVVLGGEAAVELERAYSVCPTCGSGLFPPG
jgi:hypothetical protein